jgi:phosphatidylserine decarboxylase
MIAVGVAGGVVALLLALPLAWKWQLGLRRSAAGVIACAVTASLLVGAVDAGTGVADGLAVVLVAVVALALAAGLVLWRFYRDPERSAPDRDDAVVSPADGIVVYVHRSERGELPVSTKLGRRYTLDELVRTPLQSAEAIVVGIALSFLDVHVNRAPIAGTVTRQERYPGRFASLKDPRSVYTNERATTVLDGDHLQAAVVLIASRLVRRIVSFVRAGDDVLLGQRIGAIRFGSQVDLVLPDRQDLDIAVQVGQRVRAGETVIARLGASAPPAEDAGSSLAGVRPSDGI